MDRARSAAGKGGERAERKGLGHDWALVLAGGAGTRLAELTSTGEAEAVPKQFWSLAGGRSLLGDALARAERLVPRGRVVVVVAREHAEHWRRDLAGRPAENVVVQPENRGTAPGLLLPLLTILARDARASIVALASDHHVAREDLLERAMRAALLRASDSEICLVGIEPDSPETQYGWILPGDDPHGAERAPFSGVRAFVEKPPPELAQELMRRGALWNSFLLAAEGRALVELAHRRLPGLVEALWAAVSSPRADAIDELYATLEPADFSRDVLQGAEEALLVTRARPCGWTDLGTPERVLACLASLRTARAPAPGPVSPYVLARAARSRPRRALTPHS